MHPSVARALDEVDAAVFSGDTFHTSRRDFNVFKETIERWARALPDIERELDEYEKERRKVSIEKRNGY
jgi:hypothetical protein